MTVKVPKELLNKYDRAGPRYTSYPTVPAWKGKFSEADYGEALSRLEKDREISLYVHFPFCVTKCHYCGCNSVVTRDRGAIDAYLDRVEREIGMVRRYLQGGRRVVQMHWGGGTPNYLDEAQLRRAHGLIKNRFDIADDCELSLEVDPRIGTGEQARLLRDLGFNRISLGVQDFAPEVQKAIGRIQPKTRTEALFAACREAGFSSVNLDLVYGLPGQTKESFEKTLKAVVDLGPDRIACFSYAHVPWVRENQKKVDTTRLPGSMEKFDLFCLAIDILEGAGYAWIGLDHFARENDELSVAYREQRLHRNFMGYTTRPDLPMVAFGMSGISDLCDCFSQNDSDLPGYETALDAGRLPVVRGHLLSRDDRIRRMAILNLMCNLELPLDLTRDAFGVGLDTLLADALDRLRSYKQDGFVEDLKDRIRVTALGRFFIRILCMELDAYLEGGGDKPLFSKTI